MAVVPAFCTILALVCAGAAFDARAQASLPGYDGSAGDQGQASLRGYVPPPQQAPSQDAPAQDQGQSSSDYPQDAVDERYASPSDAYDHSLPVNPRNDGSREAANTAPAYTPPPPVTPLDVARANCAALHARLEAVMRAEMQGGNPVAMKQYAAEREAIYRQEMQTGCQ